MKKLAFCFLIYDVIHHEELWNLFFKNVDPSKYSIHIHYKKNVPSKYFEKYKLARCIPTNYGDITIVNAQNLMLQDAMKNPDVGQCILLSNTCIPLKSFDYVYSFLDMNKSYFNLSPHEQCFPLCNPSLSFIQKEYIQKAHQWCILSRKHAELMLNTTEYLTWFNYRGPPPDEQCYISNIFKHGLQDEISVTNNIAAGATTFTNWRGMDYPFPSVRLLKNYTEISAEEFTFLMESKSLFGRKFIYGCKTSPQSNTAYLKCISSAPS
jgi:hypothetical protein